MLVVLLCLLGAVSIFSKRHSSVPTQPKDASTAQKVPDLPVEPPPPTTATMQAVLDKSTGFSVLISYTDRGFEGSDVTIKRGESVRFTNNSSHKLWISAVAKEGAMYPASEDGCGQSTFDSCMAMAPHEIWEMKFTKAGTWWYRNNSEQADVGVIRVK